VTSTTRSASAGADTGSEFSATLYIGIKLVVETVGAAEIFRDARIVIAGSVGNKNFVGAENLRGHGRRGRFCWLLLRLEGNRNRGKEE
jgi:hypothetical protein